MQFKTVFFMGMLLLFAASFMSVQQPKPWPVPDKAAKTANPTKSDKESVAAGKNIFQQQCASCHGKTGKGDGSKAAQLKTPLIDFASSEVQSQSDGALFYKTSEGRDEMPSFKKKIPDALDIWDVVNYIRTLKK